MVIIKSSSSFLIAMPMPMLEIPTSNHLSTTHHRVVIINASTCFLIDKPMSMLVIPTTTHLSISHLRIAIVHVFRSSSIMVPTNHCSMYASLPLSFGVCEHLS